MSTRGLVDVVLDDGGMTYIAGQSSFTMVGSLSSKYWQRPASSLRLGSRAVRSASSNELLNPLYGKRAPLGRGTGNN